MAPVAILTISPLLESAVGLDDLKEHLNVTHSDDDQVIDGIGQAATAAVEKETQRVLVQRAAVLRRSCLPPGRCPIRLPGGHVQEVTEMTVDGVPVTGLEVIGNSPALLVPAADWPVVTGQGYPVTIAYLVGPAVPLADLIIAVKMIATDMFDRRSGGGADAGAGVPDGAVRLMERHRILPVS